MKTNTFTVNSRISYNQVDPFGRTRNIALMGLLEEAAVEHCFAIDHDVFTLLEHGFGWVLHAGVLEFYHYPRYRDAIRIKTWISEWQRIRGIREFVIEDCNGNSLVKASTQWVYLDIKRRRPIAVPQLYKTRWPANGKRTMETIFIKKALPLPKHYTTEMFDVRRHDIDSNNHVHNVRYLEWILETVPEAFFHGKVLDTINGTFVREAELGDQILVQAGIAGENRLIHNVVRRADGEVLSTGYSCWRYHE